MKNYIGKLLAKILYRSEKWQAKYAEYCKDNYRSCDNLRDFSDWVISLL